MFEVQSRMQLYGNQILLILLPMIQNTLCLMLFLYKLCVSINQVDMDPVVQSIVSFTSSLTGQLVKCFITLYPNTLIFLLKKTREACFSHFFNKKYWHI